MWTVIRDVISILCLIILVWALTYLGAVIVSGDTTDPTCEEKAVTQATELYNRALTEDDSDMARHYKTLADSVVAGIDTLC